jgi:N-acetylneuraminic acid mutarotase
MASIYNQSKILLFGGEMNYSDYSDTWIFDMNTFQWTCVFPSNYPQPRAFHAMTSIPNDDEVVLFGGSTFDDTWVYDVGDNQWYDKSPALSPCCREFHAMAPLMNGDKILLYGGMETDTEHYYADLSDTWVFDRSDEQWHQKNPAYDPGAVTRETAATLASNGTVILFGGSTSGIWYYT